MIKNDTQYHITKSQAEKFAKALRDLSMEAPAQNIHPTLAKVHQEAIRSQYEELQQELKEYEELMGKIHNVQSIDGDEIYLYLTVDHRSYRIRWEDCSTSLANANMAQRKRFEVAPSGYGIHWPEIDEDLAITPLLQQAETFAMEAEEGAVMSS